MLLAFFAYGGASYTDIKKREIPDIICIFIALTGLLRFNVVNLLGIFVSLPLLGYNPAYEHDGTHI